MRRREFITLIGGGAVARAIGPGAVRAGTSSKLPIIALAALVPVPYFWSHPDDDDRR
jgi:hypothetical protein